MSKRRDEEWAAQEAVDDDLSEVDHDEEVDEEDAVAIEALSAFAEVRGRSDLAQAQRELLAAIAEEALALKERRLVRERKEAEEREAGERLVAKRARRGAHQGSERDLAERFEWGWGAQEARKADAHPVRARPEPGRREGEAGDTVPAATQEVVVPRQRQSVPQAVGEARPAMAHPPRQMPGQARTEALRTLSAPVRTGGARPPTAGPRVITRPRTRPPEPAASQGAARPESPSRPTALSMPTPTTPAVGAATRPVPGPPSVAPKPSSSAQQANVAWSEADDGDMPSLTGDDLAAWRRRLGLTQQQAAARLGVEQGTVSKGESKGRKPLGPSLRRALASAMSSGPRRE